MTTAPPGALPVNLTYDEQIPLLLADSVSVSAAVELGSQQWVSPSADGSHAEQAMIVWIAMDPYGEDYEVTGILLALPGRGLEEAIDVPAAAAYGAGHPAIGVRFVEGDHTTLGTLLPLEEAPAVVREDTFAPSLGGTVWPSTTGLCRAAPSPRSVPEVLVQFTDQGPQFSLQGDPITEGFVTPGGIDVPVAVDDDDLLPLLRSADSPTLPEDPPRGRGRGRGGRGRSSASEPSPGRGRAGRGGAGAVPRGGVVPQGAAEMLQDIKTLMREEMSGLHARLEQLEVSAGAARMAAGASVSMGPLAPSAVPLPPGQSPPGLDPLFGRAPRGPGVAAAAREAQRLLGVGAAGRHPASGPFAMPRMPSTRRSSAVTGAARAGVLDPRGAPAGAAPSAAEPTVGGTPALLERIASALEASARPGPAGASEQGSAHTLSEYLNLLNGAAADDGGGGSGSAGLGSRGVGGLWALERIKRTRRERPDLVLEAAENIAREQMGVLPGEPWNWRRHAEQELLPLCGNFTTLKRMIALVAACLDEGRTFGPEQQQALLQHTYKVLEATARDPAHEMHWSWPLLGISDPAGRKRSNFAPGEAAALVAYHRDEAALEESKKKLSGLGGRHGVGHDHVSGTDGEEKNVPWWKKTSTAKAASKAKAAAGAVTPTATPKPVANS